ncbi:LacI family DNA-binding transcriptional regulator [Clostridium estertheticum]|uniref:LacI family DNA-binding transcriptional regulator n=1 Tax=Clostridium estertheticum TaxID=238834 RepID=UPI001CF47610|nr:LacI family DNA-binding transcriptional regulator [Clostridium estertheticum]MCB2359962.1 LacI family transcriptional regulator [Clostridium estertheticum]
MKEIAIKSGVSQSTVSRVVSGSVSVNPEIKRKVMEWVRKLDYQPNIIAQSLVSNKSLLIGVIITNISNPFFAEVIKAIEGEAAKYGYSIILCNTDGNLDKEKKYISILTRYNVDGILIVPSNAKDSYFQRLRKMKMPVVVITQDIQGFSCVSISHYLSAKEVAKHLISMGFSKFLFIGAKEDEKCKGFKDQIQYSGFNLDKDFFILGNNSVNTDLKELLGNKLKAQCVGIFAYNDIEALIILHLLKEMKVEIPKRVALVGFDNTFISKEVSPTLSTVYQPIEEIGRQSIEILMENICNNKDAEEKHIIIETRLVVRQSSVKSVTY